MFEILASFWCRHFHREVFHPVQGVYRCKACLRTWSVSWSEPEAGLSVKPTMEQRTNIVEAAIH